MSVSIKSKQGYTLSTAVMEFARAQNLPLHDVTHMIDRASKCSLPSGNRRFHEWVFSVDGKQVVQVMTNSRSGEASVMLPSVRELPILRSDEFLTYDECDGCQGRGCRACDGTGEVVIIRREQKKQKFGVMT